MNNSNNRNNISEELKSALTSIANIDESDLQSTGLVDDIDKERDAIESLNTTVLPDANAATYLSVKDTPDFMSLPLELQGYCPWTIVEAKGLLIPGSKWEGERKIRRKKNNSLLKGVVY
jgi:hypothetical protein